MGQNHVGLTPSEVELLTMLAEEAAEVAQACTKALRHGLSSRHPDGGPTNAQHLTGELHQLFALSAVAHFACVLEPSQLDAPEAVLGRKLRYSHCQQPLADAWNRAVDWLGSLSYPALDEEQPEFEDWLAREGRLAQYGDLDGGIEQHLDPGKRGFVPK